MQRRNGVFVMGLWVKDDGRGGIKVGAIDDAPEGEEEEKEERDTSEDTVFSRQVKTFMGITRREHW